MSDHVLVRMYNVGFGDCFLLQFPSADERLIRVLIDCGSIAVGSLAMTDVVKNIIEDTRDEDGISRIDVVVCTHRHADHVSGFANALWKDVEVSEVWFPWTEDPKDDQARVIREAQSRLALALQGLWARRAVQDPAGAAPWQDLALNALSNDKAMTLLHEGFKSKPRRLFLSSNGEPQPVKTQALPGISAYVMGPSKSPEIIRDMDPPAGKTFLRQLDEAGDDGSGFEPFEEDWPIDPSLFDWHDLLVDPEEAQAMQQASQAWDPGVTVALEQAVNGTSLVLAFEIGEAVLFFPGDAQWGTWNALLQSKKSTDLLQRLSFWKVGHHGSHNATPTTFLTDWAPSSCCAMMSTKTGKWASIPRKPLLTAIEDRQIELARSDLRKNAQYKRFGTWTKAIVETKVPI